MISYLFRTKIIVLKKGLLIKTLLQKKQTFYCTENMQYKFITRDYKCLLNDALRVTTCVLKKTKTGQSWTASKKDTDCV